MAKSEKTLLLEKKNYNFDDLVDIVRILRGEGGCPWDAEQTHESIKKDFIEETYEVIEAINKKDPELLCEELGDVLLQVAFHAEIEEEKNVFTMSEVTDGICKKLIERHPHLPVYSSACEYMLMYVNVSCVYVVFYVVCKL